MIGGLKRILQVRLECINMRRFNKKKKPKYHTKYRYYDGLMCYAKSSKSSSHHIYIGRKIGMSIVLN